MMQVEKARAFYLPDGSYIKVETFDGGVNANKDDNRAWMAMDVNRVYPDGHDVLLSSVEWEDGKGLRTRVYDDENGEPFFEFEHIRLPRDGFKEAEDDQCTIPTT